MTRKEAAGGLTTFASDLVDGSDPADVPMGSVIVPQTGTQVRVKSVNAHGANIIYNNDPVWAGIHLENNCTADLHFCAWNWYFNSN